MPTYFSSSSFPPQFEDGNGDPAANYVLHAFLAGTTTPTNMFADNAGTSAGTTITLDSQGYPATSGTRHSIWLDSGITYDIELRDATDVTVVWDSQNISVFGGANQPTVNHATIASALADTSIIVGDVVLVKEYATGQGVIDAIYDVVASGTDTEDGFEFHNDTIDGSTFRLKLRIPPGNVNLLYAGTADVGASINTITAAGYLKIFIPTGSYTQSTALTSNQEIHLYGPYWDEFGAPPVTITKDADITHIETTAAFTSLGIRWDGNSVAGGKDGIIVHGDFHFIGQVIGQTGNGFVIDEASASHNLNNSIIGGAFSGNTEGQLVISASKGSGTNNIDINTIQFKYCRCNSGKYGLHVKGGLYNDYTYVNTKGNSEIGVFIEAENNIENNTFRIYSENTASDSTDLFAIDGWTVYGAAPTRTGNTTFTVVGDQTATFVAGGKIRCVDNGVNFYGTIDSAVFTSLTTVTVTLFGTSNVLTANLTEVSTDAANNDFKDNEFVMGRGFTSDDIYPENGNTIRNGGSNRGIFTNSEQPWVMALNSVADTNVTGDGTAYTVIFDSEIKDTQGDYDNTTGIFTAPTTGRYRFNGSVKLTNLGADTYERGELRLVTSNRTYSIYDVQLDNVKSSANQYQMNFTVVADMGSNDTATLVVEATGGTLSVGVDGDATNAQTWWSVTLEG